MPIEITYLGRNCFRLKGRDGSVITENPCPPDSGFSLGKQSAEIVTVSRRDEPGYAYTAGIGGNPMVLDAPGEYEINGILVTGIANKRPDGARNVMFISEIDGIRVGHLGLASNVSLEDSEGVDVLLLLLCLQWREQCARAEPGGRPDDEDRPRRRDPDELQDGRGAVAAGAVGSVSQGNGEPAGATGEGDGEPHEFAQDLTVMVLEPKG